MQQVQHEHQILERSKRAMLIQCHQCRQQPYALQTREGSGARLMTKVFYSDLDAAMWAFNFWTVNHERRAK